MYLKQAIEMAEEQESMDGNPLTCMPAETYLNAAIALQYSERLSQARDAAEQAERAAKRAVLALSEIP